MKSNIKTLADLKWFLNNLTEGQLSQPVRISEEERAIVEMIGAEVLDCNYINPGADSAEPITDYLEGGQFYDSAFPVDDEPIIAKKDDVYFYV